MKNIEVILSWVVANQEAILAVAVALIPYTSGKLKKLLTILHDIDMVRDNVKVGMPTSAAINEVAVKSVLTGEQARNILTHDGNGVKVDKLALAKAVASSGDGRKIQRKIKRWFKKI